MQNQKDLDKFGCVFNVDLWTSLQKKLTNNNLRPNKTQCVPIVGSKVGKHFQQSSHCRRILAP